MLKLNEFAEDIAKVNDHIYMLTWKEKKVFDWKIDSQNQI